MEYLKREYEKIAEWLKLFLIRFLFELYFFIEVFKKYAQSAEKFVINY